MQGGLREPLAAVAAPISVHRQCALSYPTPFAEVGIECCAHGILLGAMRARFGIVCVGVFLTVFTFAREDGKQSPELQSLIESYERDKARVLAPIDQKFDRDLEQLKVRFTQLGKLEEAVAVMELIEARKAKGGESGNGTLPDESTTWDWDSRGELVIHQNGTCKHSSWRKPGVWKKVEDNVIVIDAETSSFTVKFSDKDTASVSAANGKTIKITRIK